MDKVEPYDCWDGVFNGCLEDKDLDNILSILDLDYPIDGFQEDGFTGAWDATKSHCLGPIPPDMPVDKSSPVLPPPMLAAKEFKNVRNELVAFHTQSPVSVLESNHGSSSIIKPCTSKRTRSKRARSSGLSSWLSMSTPLAATRKPRKAKGWRKKSSEGNEPLDQTKPLNNEVKKCVHCEVTKTPQWREGPAGPKTLCNACGVRYRSGRLFPEYRPAASPTFMPSVHSNSHRKVVEMRSKAKLLPLVGPTSMSPEMEFVPMSSHLFDHLC